MNPSTPFRMNRLTLPINRTASILATICFVALLVGCTSGTPTEKQARTAVASEIQEYGPLIMFTKTNGESLEQAGQKRYIFHYWAAASLGDGWAWRSKSTAFKAGIQRQGQTHPLFTPVTTKIPSGSTYLARGTIQFRQTENGWVVDRTEVAEYGFCNPGPSPSECYTSLWGQTQ